MHQALLLSQQIRTLQLLAGNSAICYVGSRNDSVLLFNIRPNESELIQDIAIRNIASATINTSANLRLNPGVTSKRHLDKVWPCAILIDSNSHQIGGHDPSCLLSTNYDGPSNIRNSRKDHISSFQLEVDQSCCISAVHKQKFIIGKYALAKSANRDDWMSVSAPMFAFEC